MEQNWRHEVNKGSSTFREAKKITSTTVLGNISGGMYRRMDLNGIICSLRSICIYSNSISNSMVKSVKVHIVLIVQYQIPFNIKFNLKFPYHSPKWIQFHIMFKEIPLSSFKSLQALPPCTPVASAPASLKAKGSLSSSIPMSPWRLADATHDWEFWASHDHDEEKKHGHNGHKYHDLVSLGTFLAYENWHGGCLKRKSPGNAQGVSDPTTGRQTSRVPPKTKNIPKPWEFSNPTQKGWVEKWSPKSWIAIIMIIPSSI
jgi:hypothetical protein